MNLLILSKINLDTKYGQIEHVIGLLLSESVDWMYFCDIVLCDFIQLGLINTDKLCTRLTIDAVQNSPGHQLRGLRTDAVDFLRTKVQQENKDQSDQEAGQQKYGHDDHFLLVHTDYCKQDAPR